MNIITALIFTMAFTVSVHISELEHDVVRIRMGKYVTWIPNARLTADRNIYRKGMCKIINGVPIDNYFNVELDLAYNYVHVFHYYTKTHASDHLTIDMPPFDAMLLYSCDNFLSPQND